MRVFGGANSLAPRTSPAAYNSNARAHKVADEHMVKRHVYLVDEGLHSKEASVLSFDLRKYSGKDIWRTISQVCEKTNLLCAVSQKHQEKLTEFLKSNKYRYGVALMTLANPVSGCFGAVEGDGLLEQRETDSFLKKQFASAIFDDRPYRSCTKKLRGLVSRELSEIHSPFE